MKRFWWAIVEEATFVPFQLFGLIEFGLTRDDKRMRYARCLVLRKCWAARGVPNQGGCYCGRHPQPWP